MEATESIAADIETEKLERVRKLLQNLDQTQDSIVGASSLIMQICSKAPSFATAVVKLII